MTISKQIVKSLRADSRVNGGIEEEDAYTFDLHQHLKASAEKILLERINFVPAKTSHHFNLKQLKSKYINLNPNSASHQPDSSGAAQTSNHDGIPQPKQSFFSGDQIELSWKKPMRAGAGLFNLGNTCFLNSALQCLTYTAPLTNYLIYLDHRKHCQMNGQFCMLCAMQQHVHNIISNSGQSIKPMHILKNLRMIARHLQFGRQEDSHEFIRYTIEAMQKSCLFGVPNNSRLDVHVKATTAVHRIFGGYLRSRVTCSRCKSVSDTFDPFLDLSLDINKKGCCNLQNCLEQFVRIEVLQDDNAYKCMKCKNAVTAFKKFSIHRAPNVLMLQLKRFSHLMGSKINKELSYPAKLNLAPYLSNKPSSGFTYDLYAVLVHCGFSSQSGHYYAYAKVPNGQWYCFNDSKVFQVGVNQALNQQAYLLFYSRTPTSSNHTNGLKSKMSAVETTSKSINGNGMKPSCDKLSRPIIGPQLPPSVAVKKEFPQHTSSIKSSNSTKASTINGKNKLHSKISEHFSFAINSKPKLVLNTNPFRKGECSKLVNGSQTSSSKVSYSKPVTPSSTEDLKTGKKSAENRPPIFDQFLSDSGPTSSMSNGVKKSSGLSILSTVYSSSESESEEETGSATNSNGGYSTLVSTLATLRKTEKSLSIETSSNSSQLKKTSNLKKTHPKPAESKTLEDSNLKTVKDRKCAVVDSDSVPKTSEKGEKLTVKNDKISVKKNGSCEREPILQVLNSEIYSSDELKTSSKSDALSADKKIKAESTASFSDNKKMDKLKHRKRHHSAEHFISSKFGRQSSPMIKKSIFLKRKFSDCSSVASDEDVAVRIGKKNACISPKVEKCSRDDQSIEKLYRSKEHYEHTMRKKAKKEKKLRKENLQVLQNRISENSDYESSKEKGNQREYPKSDDKTKHVHKKLSTPPSADVTTKSYANKDETSAKKDIRTANAKERTNVLGQLLEQSSDKAYGRKVPSWSGSESVVQKDAYDTYVEMSRPVVDDWDKEYDKGKIKKVKKESRLKHTSGPGHNVFQKFQNVKNEKSADGYGMKKFP